jgi:hypothetical protein
MQTVQAIREDHSTCVYGSRYVIAKLVVFGKIFRCVTNQIPHLIEPKMFIIEYKEERHKLYPISCVY